MEQLIRTTPNKAENKFENFNMDTPKAYYTPVKKIEMKSKHAAYRNGHGCLTVLQNHITPPSSLTKFIARNPFENDLTNRLHLSVISPTVFNKSSSPLQRSPGFKWSIEELAMMQPAKIEEFPIQQMHTGDPDLEVKAQAAIDKFFKANEIIPSPWELKKKEKSKSQDSTRSATSNHSLTTNQSKATRDGWSQTVLSLPPQLPPYIEEILKPYFIFTQDQHNESDDANSSNSSLRRKLFFNHDEADNDESSIILSPVKIDGSSMLPSSPPQSGMFIHGSPVKRSTQKLERTHGTPVVVSENITPLDMSPIENINMSCESIRSKSRSVVKLDFTDDMRFECSVIQNRDYQTECSLDLSLSKACMNSAEKHKQRVLPEADSILTKTDSPIKTEWLRGNSTVCENDKKVRQTEFTNNVGNVPQKFKPLTDLCKTYDNESCAFQQTNSLAVISDQQSVSNSVQQDTGYQTCSMSNTANVTDSYTGTPVKQKVYWSDEVRNDDELRLSDWKENMKNIFCSTPSRSTREKDIFL